MLDYGIDGIGVALPSYFVDCSVLANYRKLPVEKYHQGLGCHRFAFPSISEDAVTLGAAAAQKALFSAGIPPKDVDICVVATESAVDQAKTVSSFIHTLLDLSPSALCFDIQQTCFGGTAAVQMVIAYMEQFSLDNGLIICTDIATYPLLSSAEPTQGGGAIALLIRKNPKFLQFNFSDRSIQVKPVYDFWRPSASGPAQVDGTLSVREYLDSFVGCYAQWQKKNNIELSGICYHTPFPKMALKAYQKLCEISPVFQKIEQQIIHSIRFASLSGNLYTASLYLALLSLIFHENSTNPSDYIGFFGYGSGSTGQFYIGQLGPSYKEITFSVCENLFSHQQNIDMIEYEELHRLRTQQNYLQINKELSRKTLNQDFFLSHIDEQGKRYYQKNTSSPARIIR